MRKYYDDFNEEYERGFRDGYAEGKYSVLDSFEDLEESAPDIDYYLDYPVSASNSYSFSIIDEKLKDYLKSLCKGGMWSRNMGWSGELGRSIPIYTWKLYLTDSDIFLLWVQTGKTGTVKIDWALTAQSSKAGRLGFSSSYKSRIPSTKKDEFKHKISSFEGFYSDMEEMCKSFVKIMEISKQFKKELGKK